MMHTNSYEILKNKQQKEFNNFPIFFAFCNEQFKDQMEKLGLTESDTDKIFSIGNGGFIKKTDELAFNNMITKLDTEFKQAIANDKDGTGFIKDMFLYELANHEFIITYDIEDTLDALSLTFEDLEKNEKLKHGLKLAKKEYLASFQKEKTQEREER